MIFQQSKLVAGLYIVATPIGNARDITLRALDILASADVIAAEDTRTARRLMEIHGVPLGGRKLIAYHDHSNSRDRDRIVDLIRGGASVALASEAGTPMISDPGYGLVAQLSKENLMLTAAPGASAALAALCVSGLPSDSFYFAGFLPNKSAMRRKALQNLAEHETTLILYESPRRLESLLTDIAQTLGETCPVVVCRELTKRFEEVQRGDAKTVLKWAESGQLRGECVVLVGHAERQRGPSSEDVEAALMDAMRTMRIKDAAALVAGSLDLPRRDVYQMALRLKGDS